MLGVRVGVVVLDILSVLEVGVEEVRVVVLVDVGVGGRCWVFAV